MAVSIFDRMKQFDRQRPPGRSIPKIIAERLARYFPKILVGWDGARKMWCLAAQGRRGVEFLCHVERDGKYTPLTLRNTVDWLRAGEIARVARTKYELDRYRHALESFRTAQRAAIQKRALDQMRIGDKEMYHLGIHRKVVPIHGRRSQRKNRS